MRPSFWQPAARLSALALWLALGLALAGCGGSSPDTPPSQDLTEEQKQQIKDLDQQRQEEWKSTKGK